MAYTRGRGESMIDYVLAREETKEEEAKLEIRENVESDHHPLVV